ncbi:MAG: hypothetical protein U1F35_05295 [Steroidobacteraceae bacterium]
MLTLKTRPCRIGPSINTRTERHGDEDVPALYIPIGAVLLNDEEINTLLREPLAHEALFNTGGAMPEPMLPMIKALKLKDKFEECRVALLLGLKREKIELQGVKVAKVSIEPLPGGLTAMEFTIQTTPDDLEFAPLLLAFLNREAEIDVDFGQVAKEDKTQAELPLNAVEQGEEQDKPKRHRRRKDGDDSPRVLQ